jgi:type IV secretion system protein VirD4
VRSRAPATTCAPSTGRAIDPPLLLCLDEAANVAPLPNLDELASTGPGQGVQLLSVFQYIPKSAIAGVAIALRRSSPTTAHACSGRESATAPPWNTYARSSGRRRSNGSPPTANASSSTSAHAPPTTTTNPSAPPTASAKPTTTPHLIYGRLPPAWLQLRPWYRDRDLKRIVTATGNACTPATLAPAPAAEEIA